jgi:hypothetical protein
MSKLSVAFQIDLQEGRDINLDTFESYLRDLLVKSALPALNCELVPLSMTVKKARK